MRKYCSKCGSRLVKTTVSASQYRYYTLEGPIQCYSDYSNTTGEKQFCNKYKCPNSTRWLNKHTDYIDDKVFTLTSN